MATFRCSGKAEAPRKALAILSAEVYLCKPEPVWTMCYLTSENCNKSHACKVQAPEADQLEFRVHPCPHDLLTPVPQFSFQ